MPPEGLVSGIGSDNRPGDRARDLRDIELGPDQTGESPAGPVVDVARGVAQIGYVPQSGEVAEPPNWPNGTDATTVP